MLIGDLIRRRARISPGRVFWKEESRSLTYAQLNLDANRVARALLAEGLRPGNHIAICADNSYEYAAVHFGAAKAGLVLAHLSPRLTAVEVGAMGSHCDAELMLFGENQADVIEGARQALPRVRRWITLPAGGEFTTVPSWAGPLSEWVAPQSGEEPDLARFAVHPGAPAVFPEAPFQLLYTSGTTGVPKGVLISHRAKIAQGGTHVINMNLRAGDRVWNALPLCHQYAQWLVLASVPLAGATVVAAPRFDSALCWEALRGEDITHLPAVPTMLYRMLDDPAAGQAPDPQLRGIVYGGAPMDVERISALRFCFPGARLFQGFGQTEVGYCMGMLDEEHNLRPESLGKADIYSEIRLLNEDGREVDTGEVGEIVASTPYLMNGYYKDAIATETFFTYGPASGRTGDLAICDEEGFYTLAGRLIDMVVSGGMNIYPSEVEKVLLAHPSVAEAAVFGIPDREWGESVVAAVIPTDAAQADHNVLISHLRENLAAYKCPRLIEFHSELPRTHNGKVRKVELRAPFLR